MKNILIVEDDRTLGEGLAEALLDHDTATVLAGTIAEARAVLAKTPVDLVLLDCNLPDGNGIGLCREMTEGILLPENKESPVIFLTVRDGEMDEVMAFRAGAWDYVKKPFSLTVLRERMGAALRKREAMRHTAHPVDYADDRYRFDFAGQRFTVDGQPVILSGAEQRLLSLFTAHRGQVLRRQTLVERLWACAEEYIDENALSVAVKRLRDKLGPDCIGTVYGLGYIWKGDGV